MTVFRPHVTKELLNKQYCAVKAACNIVSVRLMVMQVMQAKKQLLDKLHAEVADKEDLPLKRMLSEDDNTMKRREQCQTRVQLLRKAAEEISSVSF